MQHRTAGSGMVIEKALAHLRKAAIVRRWCPLNSRVGRRVHRPFGGMNRRLACAALRVGPRMDDGWLVTAEEYGWSGHSCPGCAAAS